MDCMDCHKRPTHDYLSPVEAVNLSLSTGRLDPQLSFIKREGVKVLSARYDTAAAAHEGIQRGIHDFHEQRFPELLSTQSGEIVRTVGKLQEIFDENFFPAMKARWRAMPCAGCHSGGPN